MNKNIESLQVKNRSPSPLLLELGNISNRTLFPVVEEVPTLLLPTGGEILPKEERFLLEEGSAFVLMRLYPALL